MRLIAALICIVTVAHAQTPQRYAVVCSGKVATVMVWDGDAPWSPPDGCEVVLDQYSQAQAGGIWDGARFLAVPDATPVPRQRLPQQRRPR